MEYAKDARGKSVMMKTLQTTIFALLLAMFTSMAWAAQTITYYHLDALGSPIAATNEQGNVVWKEAYEPYGERIRNEAASSSNDVWFTGKQEDSRAGLSYFGARWYDPVVGRFMGIDPVGFEEGNPHTYNRFAYANNNPYKYIDPNGKASCLNAECSRSSIDTDIDGDGTIDVTFVNDNPSNPSPPNDLKTVTAITIENAIRESGIDTININSTTGGIHGTNSDHPSGGAVDYNMVNGKPVNALNQAVKALQDAAAKQSDIRENFGPFRNEKTVKTYDPKTNIKGTKTVQKPNQEAKHKTHGHISAR